MADEELNINDNFQAVSKRAAELSTKLHVTAVNAQQMGITFKNMTLAVTGSALAFNEINKTLTSFNKSLYDLSRQGKVAGQSFADIRRAIDNIGSSTSLSKREAADFIKEFQNVKGIRLSSAALSDFAKALTSEFGPALENLKGAMGDLIDVQQKDVTILNRLRAGMSTKEVYDYVMSLEKMEVITSKQGDSLIRTAEAMSKQGNQLSEQDKKLRRATDAQQKLSKAWEDVKVDWAEKLAETLPKISEALSQMVGIFKTIPMPVITTLAKLAMVGGVMQVAGGIGKLGGIGTGTTTAATGGAGAGILSRLTGQAPSGQVQQVHDARLYNALASNSQKATDALGVTKNETKKMSTNLLGIKGGTELGAPTWKGLGTGLKDGFQGVKTGLYTGYKNIAGALNESPMLKAGVGFAITEFGGSAAEMLRKSGSDRAGAGVSAASKIGGYAMMGSAVAGPAGAIAGATVGILSSAAEIGEALGEVPAYVTPLGAAFRDQYEMEIQSRQRAKLIQDMYGVEVKEMPGLWVKWKEGVLGGISHKFGGSRDYIKEAEEEEVFGKIKEKRYKAQYGEEPGIYKTLISGTIGQLTEKITGQQKGIREKKILDDAKAEMRILHEEKKKMGIVGADVGTTFSAFLKREMAKGVGLQAATQTASGKVKIQKEREGLDEKEFSDIIEERKKEYEKQNSPLEKQRQLYHQINGEIEYTNRLAGIQIQAYEKTANYLLNYKDDLSGAKKEYDKMIDAQKLELKLLQASLAMRRNNNNVEASRETIIQELMSMTGMSRDEANKSSIIRAALSNDENIILSRQNELLGNITQTEIKRNNAIEVRKSVVEENISLIESELNITKQMYLGLGPTLDAQMRLVDQIEQAIELTEQQLADQKQLQIEGKDGPEVKKEIIRLQTKQNQLVSKELEVTKNLREGYLDAMGAFTNVEGAFSKVIQKREQGMGEMIRRFGVQGGLKAGAGGAGGLAPQMRWGPGGQMELSSLGEMNAVAASYQSFMPRRGMLGTAQAYEQNPAALSRMYSGQDATAQIEAQQSAAWDRNNTPNVSGITGGDYGPEKQLDKLNKNMSSYVSEGIKNAGGLGGGGNAPKDFIGPLQPTKEEREQQRQQEKEDFIGPLQLTKEEIEQGEKAKKKSEKRKEGIAKIKEMNKMEREEAAVLEKETLDYAKKLQEKRKNVARTDTEKMIAGVAHKATQPERAAKQEVEKVENAIKGVEKTIAKRKLMAGDKEQSPQEIKDQENLNKRLLELTKYKEGLDKRVAEELSKSVEKLIDATKDNTKVTGEEIEYVAAAESAAQARKNSGYAPSEYGENYYGLETTSPWPEGMATGGFVAGSGSGDTVPAMLAPGEHVTNSRAARKYANLLRAINAQHFADGGFVGGLSGPSAPAPGGGGSGGFSPNIAINVKGESVNKMTRMVMTQLSGQLNKMMKPSGSTARFHDYTST